jgi:catechol 2,3-dioxygenase
MMVEMSAPGQAHAPVIHPATTIGEVRLTVADLERSLAFYEDTFGLGVVDRDGGTASIGTGGKTLVILDELPGARPAPRATGLFHFALLVPDRASLARWLAHAARMRVELQGLSDHFVSEAIYLADPDGHGIEVYADRPRAAWEGQTHRLTTEPLDIPSLLSELADPATEPFTRLPVGTVMGHVHLQVRDVPEAIRFYRDVLGFDLQATYGTQAAFLGAGGYHHDIGANTWNSLRSGPPPAEAAALRYATIVLPDAATLDAVAGRVAAAGAAAGEYDDALLVRDPAGVPLLLRSR